MRKFYLLFAAMFAYSVVATAGIKNLFKQDFETCGTPQNAGWTSPNLAGGMSIASSENGSWFEFSLGGNNNRNAVMDFNYGQEEGATIYGDQSMKKYTVKFQWGIQANTSSPATPKNAQFSTEVAVITPSIVAAEDVPEGWKITGSINNGQYAGNDSLRLFSITQLKGAYAEDNAYWADENDNTEQALNALKTAVVDLLNGEIVKNNVKAATTDAKFMQSVILQMATSMAKDGDVRIEAKDAEALRKYFAANAKDVLARGIKIEEVKGLKTDFQIVSEKAGYKLAFGEAEFEAFFKAFLRPQLIELLF